VIEDIGLPNDIFVLKALVCFVTPKRRNSIRYSIERVLDSIMKKQ
jgi:hypothetical protein